MLIYLEKKVKNDPIAQQIIQKLAGNQILEIDHYKNIFDKNIWNQSLAPAFIIAKQEKIPLLPVPPNYGYPGKAFFFKTSLNCIFDCEYCYLKGNFKTQYPVIFVNYTEIQQVISDKIHELRSQGYKGPITFYASNYSDVQGIDQLSQFNQHFFPFFEQFEGVLMETRTKSANIDSILQANHGKVMNNTEIAFSLNPREIIHRYEKKTAPLELRFQAINHLLQKGYKVWLRFLPLLAVKDYQSLYPRFLEEVKRNIPINQINSIFMASLIYNTGDFKTMQKKNPESDLRENLVAHPNGLIKLSDQDFQNFIDIFESAFPQQTIYFDFI